MVQVQSTIIIASLEFAGFQGFNPLTTGEKAKMSLSKPELTTLEIDAMQKAVFKEVTVIQATDTDVGDGTSFVYDKISTKTDIIYAMEADVAPLATAIVASEGGGLIVTAELDNVNGLKIVSTFTSIPATPEVPPLG